MWYYQSWIVYLWGLFTNCHWYTILPNNYILINVACHMEGQPARYMNNVLCRSVFWGPPLEACKPNSELFLILICGLWRIFLPPSILPRPSPAWRAFLLELKGESSSRCISVAAADIDKEIKERRDAALHTVKTACWFRSSAHCIQTGAIESVLLITSLLKNPLV